MIRLVYGFVFAVSIVLLVGCSNVKDLKFTDSNRDDVLQKIKVSKDLTGEENQLLQVAMMRYAFNGQSLTGKKVGDLLSEQKKINADMEAKEKEAKILAEEAAKKEAALALELSKYLTVVPFEKSFQKADYMSGDLQDYVVVSFVFENKSEKEIRAFKGIGRFKDLFGELIHETKMTYDEGIKGKSKVNWAGSMKYNQFIPSISKLRDTELNNIKFEWVPKGIIFADGSTLGIEASK